MRGAYSKVASLIKNQKLSGVFTAFSGNYAQGVALAASHLLGISSVIIMSINTSEIKIDDAVRSFW